MHKLPHLYKNRFGVFYLRIIRDGREAKKSLRTKDFGQARIYALAFNLEIAMGRPKITDFELNVDAVKPFDVILPDGTQIKDLNSDEDIRRAKELFGSRFETAAPLHFPILAPETLAAMASQRAADDAKKRSAKPFADVVKL